MLLRKSRGRAASLALLIDSVDSFARYGDEHGPVAADEYLRRIARELRDASLVRVRVNAERIRSIVESLEIGLGRSTFGPVTVSIGVGYACDAGSVGARDFMDSAGGALQGAIRRGGNAVAFAAGDAALDEASMLPDYARVLSLG